MANVGKTLGGAASGAATGFAAGGPVGGVVGGAIGAISGLFGNDDEAEAAAAARKAAIDRILAIQVPGLEDQRLSLAHQYEVGELTPEALGTITQADSEMKGISTDPRLRQAQMTALAEMQGLGRSGLSAQDRSDLGSIRRNVATEANARDQAVLQNMAQRGVAGGGAELAARLSSSQAAMNDASAQGDRIAAMAQNKALQAIMNSGQLGGQIQAQDFGQAERVASAQDAINRFNAANSQSVSQYNVQGRNAAQAANLSNKQNIANTNVGVDNQSQIHNKGLYQQEFDNRLKQATAAAGPSEYDARAHDSAQKANDAGLAGLSSGLMDGYGQLAKSQGWGKPKAEEDEKLGKGSYTALPASNLKGSLA
jgi:hypothetical protein